MDELITIVIPCRNEERYIRRCIESILAFEIPAGVQNEILVLDGCSTDGTRSIVEEFTARDSRIRWLENPGLIQSCALNLGIRIARGRRILRLDAHTQYPPEYLLLCHSTAIRTGAANVGGVCATQPGGDSYQAHLVQALTTHPFGVGNSGFRIGAPEGPRDTVPFGYFQRDLFNAIGLFDERLPRNQDYEFNRRIIASGRLVWLNPAIASRYYNQPTMTAFLKKQFTQEAPYNAYTWYLAPYAFAWRHAITAVFTMGLIVGLTFSAATRWIAYPFISIISLYGVIAIISSVQLSFRYRQPGHVLALPFCFFAYHSIHGLGVLTGLARLALGLAPVQSQRPPWPGAVHRRWAPGIGWTPPEGTPL